MAHFHQPQFPENQALFIIWCRDPNFGRYTLAAGSLKAMWAAWDVLQTECPRADLTMQQGARVLVSRAPLIAVSNPSIDARKG